MQENNQSLMVATNYKNTASTAPFKLNPLPFNYKDLEPHMSQETIEYHYDKHHQAYIDNLNKAVFGTEFEDYDLETIILKSSGKVFDNAAQVWNHGFFWNCLSPDTKEPNGAFVDALKKDFGSFHNFKTKFSETSAQQFGSGWGWLAKNRFGKLEILSTANADNPMTDGYIPLLTCDVWEHSYYIDFRNKRPDFLNAFWKIVNWDFVAKNFTSPLWQYR